MKSDKKWWGQGVQFQCQGSGNCCTSRGEYGFVFLTKADRKRMAEFLKIPTQTFTRKYCQNRSGAFHLKEDGVNLDCMFLKNKRCSIYKARPTQCRTWPFWPEVMNAKTWSKEVASFCPGVGKGPVVAPEKIRQQMNEQIESEDQILQEAIES